MPTDRQASTLSTEILNAFLSPNALTRPGAKDMLKPSATASSVVFNRLAPLTSTNIRFLLAGPLVPLPLGSIKTAKILPLGIPTLDIEFGAPIPIGLPPMNAEASTKKASNRATMLDTGATLT